MSADYKARPWEADGEVLRGYIDSIERTFSEKSNDLFFIPLQRMNRVVLAEAIDFHGMPYVRSGFVGSVSLLAKGRIPEGVTTLDARARERVIGEMAALLRYGETIAVEDYMRRFAISHLRLPASRSISRIRPRLRPHSRRTRRAAGSPQQSAPASPAATLSTTSRSVAAYGTDSAPTAFCKRARLHCLARRRFGRLQVPTSK
jgi:hypothetical protein